VLPNTDTTGMDVNNPYGAAPADYQLFDLLAVLELLLLKFVGSGRGRRGIALAAPQAHLVDPFRAALPHGGHSVPFLRLRAVDVADALPSILRVRAVKM